MPISEILNLGNKFSYLSALGNIIVTIFFFQVRFVSQIQAGMSTPSVFINSIFMTIIYVITINYVWIVEVAISLIFYFSVFSWQAKSLKLLKKTLSSIINMNITNHSQYASPFVHISKSMLDTSCCHFRASRAEKLLFHIFLSPYFSHLVFCQLLSFNYSYQNILKMVRVMTFDLINKRKFISIRFNRLIRKFENSDRIAMKHQRSYNCLMKTTEVKGNLYEKIGKSSVNMVYL